MKRYLPLLLLGLLPCLTSCLGDNDPYTMEETESYTDCYNVVLDNSTGETSVSEKPKYTFKYRYADNKTYLTVSMTGIKLGSDVPYESFTLPEMVLTVPTDATSPMTLRATDIEPTNSTISNSVIFDTFQLRILRRVVYNESGVGTYQPVYMIQYSVNGKYRVGVYPTKSYFFGNSESTNMTTGGTFKSDSPRYAITYDPVKLLATIDITGAAFEENMPAMNMTFKDIPYTASPNNLVLASDNLVPEIAGTPYPMFPISDLKAVIQPTLTSTLDFNCTVSTLDNAVYKVSVNLTDLQTGTATVQE